MHKNKEVIQDAKIIIANWLKERGLRLSEEKTNIVHSMEGFDFLGFNCRQYDIPETGYHARNNKSKPDFKLLIKPSKKSIRKHVEKLREVFKQVKALPQVAVINKLNPIITGWTNYYRNAVSSKVFVALDHIVWKKLWSWAQRRHPMKGKNWIADKYWHTVDGRKWRFATTKNGEVNAVLKLHAQTKIKRHVMVKAGKSFYDGNEIYWASRLRREAKKVMAT
jgi:RNA-directed DNA polymerase